MRDTIDMAREAWISETEAEMLRYSEECYLSCTYLSDLKAFEALVRADEREQGQKWFDAVTAQHKAEILAEREACAKVCEQYENDMGYGQPQKCADAIRARGETK